MTEDMGAARATPDKTVMFVSVVLIINHEHLIKVVEEVEVTELCPELQFSFSRVKPPLHTAFPPRLVR